MFEIIVAMTKDGGIGLNGELPWKCKEELNLFKEKTMGHIVVMGRKTVEKLPHLEGRDIWCLTYNENLDTSMYKNTINVKGWLYTILEAYYKLPLGSRKLFFSGSSKFLSVVKANIGYSHFSKYHISVMKKDYPCDTFCNLKLDLKVWTITDKKEYEEFTHYVYEQKETQERKYTDLLENVLKNGTEREGRNGITKSVFGCNLEFDLTKGFPLITTKKMFWRGIVEELLFFLRGYTDSKILEEKGVNIWQGNTNRAFLDGIGMTKRKEGIMGPMYGWQWRNFGGEYNTVNEDSNEADLKRVKKPGFDQLTYVIDLIKTDPHSRRIMMTDYNPTQAKEGVLYPCHSIALQFYVNGEYLDMVCFNRSQDLFHGVPFNIASSSLLLLIIAKVTGKEARRFILNMGDTHIYAQHYSAVEEQLKRCPFVLPNVVLNKDLHTVQDIENLEFEDFELKCYMSHPAIKADMVA